METLFDFNPTAQELEDIAFFYLLLPVKFDQMPSSSNKAFYLERIKPEWAKYDIAALHEERGDQETADKYWAQIPTLAKEYRQQDYFTLPS